MSKITSVIHGNNNWTPSQAIDGSSTGQGKAIVALRTMFCTAWECTLLQRRVLVSDMLRALATHGQGLTAAGQSRLGAREWLSMHALNTQLCCNLNFDHTSGMWGVAGVDGVFMVF